MKFVLIDAANLFNRAHHVCGGDAFTKAGMALHIIFNSLDKAFRQHGGNHLVLCAEGRSWRYDYYPQYKAKRRMLREMQSPKEKEEQEVFYDVLKDFIEFMSENTRCTVLQSQGAEADDLIARFIQLHPNDEHMVLSGDSDMVQLVAPNVTLFNGVTNQLVTHEGVFDDRGREMVFTVKPGDGKLKIGLTLEEAAKAKKKEDQKNLRAARDQEAVAEVNAKALHEAYDALLKDGEQGVPLVEAKSAWVKADKELNRAKVKVLQMKAEADKDFSFERDPHFTQRALFVKCIRGDSGDGVFSAYPGVRYKGSAKKVGIEDAWNDRETKGFHWNNFMLQRWDKLLEDGTSVDVSVKDEYERNVTLIDLTAQPADIKELLDRVIIEAVQKQPVGNVGIHFLQFCQKHDLNRIAERAQDHSRYLNASYFGPNK
jgi:major membrane immunogen (membrane-anchored lipoprotein)